VSPYLLLPLAYLLGAVPTSHWVGQGLFGIDLRRKGSGNLGATNTLRVLGWKAAVPVLFVDVAKGFVPAAAFPRLDGSGVWAWSLAYGSAAILGHVFSLWVGFRGGKGVATSAGVFLALAPLSLLAGFGVWLALALGTRIVSLASMAAAVTVFVTTVLAPPPEGGAALTRFTGALAVFVLWAHRSNIARLVRGEEHRFGEKPRTEGAARE